MAARRPSLALLVQVFALLAACVLARVPPPTAARSVGHAAITVAQVAHAGATGRLERATQLAEGRRTDGDEPGGSPSLAATAETALVGPAHVSALDAPRATDAAAAHAPARAPTARGPPTDA